jgi:hypothetical protein
VPVCLAIFFFLLSFHFLLQFAQQTLSISFCRAFSASDQTMCFTFFPFAWNFNISSGVNFCCCQYWLIDSVQTFHPIKAYLA